MYHASPLQLSSDEESVEKQTQLGRTVHELGGEVLMSSHTWVPMTAEETITHARALASRGADMIKIAMIANTEAESMETFRATALLKHETDTPYLLVCMGQYGKFHRQIGPLFGSAMALCVQQYTTRSHKDQALLRATRAVFDNVDWNPAGTRRSGPRRPSPIINRCGERLKGYLPEEVFGIYRKTRKTGGNVK
jgi:hypothetical protein